MKLKSFLLLASILVFNVACSDDDDKINDSYIDVYVVGYDMCGGEEIDSDKETGVAKCYYFITADFKDTIKSPEFPEGALEIPVKYFEKTNKGDAVAFPDEYNYDEISARIKYSRIPEEDWTYYTCTHDMNMYTRFHGSYQQVKIEAVSDLKFK